MSFARRHDHRMSPCVRRIAFWIGWRHDEQDLSQPNQYACPGISDTFRGVSVPNWLILLAAPPIQNATGPGSHVGEGQIALRRRSRAHFPVS